jgi:SAM-dependent methyltransferase
MRNQPAGETGQSASELIPRQTFAQSPDGRSHCPICRRAAGRTVWVASDHQAKHCDCGVVYMDPIPPSGSVDLTTEKHSEGYYSFSAGIRLQWVQSLQPSGRLLEVGCGGGYFLAAARDAGYTVAGIDPDPEAVAFVRDRFGIPVEEAFIEESELEEGIFDVVFHVDLLSHFIDPVVALEAMIRRVRPGGYICFEVGGQGAFATEYYAWRKSAGYPFHLWLYEERAVRKLLQQAGLEVVEVRRFGLLAGIVLLTAGQVAQRLLGGIGARAPGTVRFSGQSRARSAWDWAQHVCRYRIGPWMPPIGPQTLWVAARRKTADGAPRGD